VVCSETNFVATSKADHFPVHQHVSSAVLNFIHTCTEQYKGQHQWHWTSHTCYRSFMD